MLESRYNNAERTASNPPTIAFLRDCNGYKQCPGVNASVRVWDAIFSASFKPRPPNVRQTYGIKVAGRQVTVGIEALALKAEQ